MCCLEVLGIIGWIRCIDTWVTLEERRSIAVGSRMIVFYDMIVLARVMDNASCMMALGVHFESNGCVSG